MNLNELQRKLLAAARSHPPGDRVPYAFEKRILARLADTPVVDHWAWWARGLWRAAAPCVALSLLLLVWTWTSSANSAPTEEFAQQFENTVLAAVDHAGESAW